jgi:hypothetical protein
MLVVAWILAVVAASILYQRARRKPILFFTVPDADFVERGASGHSTSNLLTKLGGANRCLVVAIARGRLVIRPHFPFNLMFLPEIGRLELDAPLDQVVSAQVKHGLSRRRLELLVRTSPTACEGFTLYLAKPDDFLKLLSQDAVTGAA